MATALLGRVSFYMPSSAPHILRRTMATRASRAAAIAAAQAPHQIPTDQRKDQRPETLCTPQWLKENMGDKEKKIKIVDCSWAMPNEKRDTKEEYLKVRIPGALRFDIDTICDKSTTLPHMLPTVSQFSADLSKLGINTEDTIVCYDSSGKFIASARVWWTLRMFGHKSPNLYVLDGGLPRWLSEGMPTESGSELPQVQSTVYIPRYNMALLRTMDTIKKNLANKEYEIVDARASDRFQGTTPEPRPAYSGVGLKSGHIPGSKNLVWTEVLDIPNNTFKSNEEIVEAFKKAGVDTNSPIITTCGSGVTASVLSLAAHLTGMHTALYDGSWSEYGYPYFNNPVTCAPQPPQPPPPPPRSPINLRPVTTPLPPPKEN